MLIVGYIFFALSSFKHVIIKKLTFSRRQASKKILPTKDGDDLHITYIKRPSCWLSDRRTGKASRRVGIASSRAAKASVILVTHNEKVGDPGRFIGR